MFYSDSTSAVKMKICSPLALLRRNHLPIVSMLGCISCLYILSQKDALNDRLPVGNSINLEFNKRDFKSSEAVQKQAPVKENVQVVEGAVAANRPAEVKAAPPPDAHQGLAPIQNPAPGPVISYNDPERVKFPGYEQCAKVDFQPEHSMPLAALAAYMASGDVIIRQRLQAATGIYTGTWNEAEAEYPRSKSGVFKGSTIDYKLGRTVAAKTQIATPDHIATFEGGALLVIRNPHTMIIAEYIRRKEETNPTKKFSTEEIAAWFRLPDWKTFFETEIGNWRSFAIQWVTFAKKILIVSYEYFLENPVLETTRMIVFLNVQQDDGRISCSIQAYPRDHLNKAIEFDPYTSEMKQTIDKYTQEVNQTIITKGLRPLPTWKNTF